MPCYHPLKAYAATNPETGKKNSFLLMNTLLGIMSSNMVSVLMNVFRFLVVNVLVAVWSIPDNGPYVVY